MKKLFTIIALLLTLCSGVYAQTVTKVTLAWDPSPSAANIPNVTYNLYRSASVTTNAFDISILENRITNTSDLEFIDTDIVTNQPYTYGVSAVVFNEDGTVQEESVLSNLVTIVPIDPPTFKELKLTKPKVRVDWNQLNTSNITYELYLTLGTGIQTLVAKGVDITSADVTFSAFVPGFQLNKGDVLPVLLKATHSSGTTSSTTLNVVYNPPGNIIVR